MKTKVMEWYEYECPECDTSISVGVPPFPAVSTCPECGRSWNVQKLREKGYLYVCKERVPS